MNKISPIILVIAVVISLLVGGIAGFFLGVASTKAGEAFLQGMVEQEKKAEVSSPKKLDREQFELQYPSNWNVDTADKDYDPDHMFSIDSPGSAFVMFVIGPGETEPEETLQTQIQQFKKLMGNPSIDRFERYGCLAGKGAKINGRILGIRTTVKCFALHQNGQTVIITQQCPDEDMQQVTGGLNLIESSFVLKSADNKRIPNKPDAGEGQ